MTTWQRDEANRALLAEHELQKKSKEVISLNNKHKMTVKAYKGLQKEVGAWPRALTKFER